MTTEKTLTNHLGETVPVKYVPKIDLYKDKITKRKLKDAIAIADKLAEFKVSLLADCDAIYEQMKDDADVRTGVKGNYSITSFDKSIKIEISVQERIEFGDEINLAQAKIQQFLTEKTKGIDSDLSQIINQAFQTNRGRLDTKRVLGLFSLKIEHKTWREAMELLKKSINRNSAKRYVRISQKDAEGKTQYVTLDFSAI
jgi:hypothetical protein